MALARLMPAASRDPPGPLLPSLAAVAHPDVESLRVAEVDRPGTGGDRDRRTAVMLTRCRIAGSSGELHNMLATASEPLAAPGAAAPALVPVEQANDEAALAMAPDAEGEHPTADNLFVRCTALCFARCMHVLFCIRPLPARGR